MIQFGEGTGGRRDVGYCGLAANSRANFGAMRIVFLGVFVASSHAALAQTEKGLLLVPTMKLDRIDTLGELTCKDYATADGRYTTRICFYDTVKLASCQSFVDGKAYGKFISWYANGSIRNITFYVAECPYGVSQEFHENGVLAAQGEYYLETTDAAISLPPPSTDTVRVEEPDGGKTLQVISYQCKGRKDGQWMYYDPDGHLLRSEQWRRGVLQMP